MSEHPPTVFDLRALVRRIGNTSGPGWLRWRSAWDDGGDPTVALGLVDGDLPHDDELPDVVRTRLVDGSRTRSHALIAASVAVARGRQRLRGIAAGASLHAVAVYADNGTASPCQVARALDTLRESGVEIIAIPGGGSDASPGVAEAVARCLAEHVLVVAAAGNTRTALVAFPARLPGVIAVSDGTVRARRVDVIAPSRVPAIAGDGPLVRVGGSSVACVVVASVLALARAAGRIPRGADAAAAIAEVT